MKAVKRADATSQPAPGGPRRAPRRVRALAGAGAVLAAAGALAGCSAVNPATVLTPYAAADGVNADLGDVVALRDVYVVAQEKGGRGAVVGTLVNRTTEAVTVELATDLGETAQPTQTRVTVPPSGRVLIGPEGLGSQQMVVEDLPVGPGEVIGISAATAGVGAIDFQAPVLPEGQYAGLTVEPTTPAATPTGTPSAETSDPAGDTGVGQSSAVPTDEESAGATESPTEEP